jgi:O-acetyl-ADP-ribose deacetylase (regulator of RNase III)
MEIAMARKGQAEIGITVKVGKLTPAEKTKLRKALKAVVSIMDAHDLKTLTLPGVATRYHRIRK